MRDIWSEKTDDLDLAVHGSGSTKVKGHGANRWRMGDFLFDFYWPHHHICHPFLNIWCQILMTLNYEGSRS